MENEVAGDAGISQEWTLSDLNLVELSGYDFSFVVFCYGG